MDKKEIEAFLKDRIRSQPLESVAGKLGLLPLGIEVILAHPWTIEECEKYAFKLGWELRFELIEII